MSKMSYRDIQAYTQQIGELLDELEEDIGPTNRRRVACEIISVLDFIDESAASTETTIEDIIRTAKDAL